MSAYFKPPLSIRIHEASHAVACVGLRLPVETIITDLLAFKGHVKLSDNNLPQIVDRFIRICGPIGQQMYVPTSIHDLDFQGQLFSQDHLRDPRYYLTCRANLNRMGWFADLDECYAAICASRTEASKHIDELAPLEMASRSFLAEEVIKTTVLAIADRLGDELILTEESLAELNTRQDEFVRLLPPSIRDARFTTDDPSRSAAESPK